MGDEVRLEKHGDVAALVVHNPPVNALSQAVRQGLADGVAAGLADDEVKAVVIAAEGRTFIAGADIREFGTPPQPPRLPDVIDGIERADRPVVVVLHGTTLGGGFEVALGCHYRIALPGSRVGLPEVTLGLLPGAGGTQRTPRLVGARQALEMITSGRQMRVEDAVGLGLVDEIIDSTPLAAGLEFARRVIDEGRPVRRVRDLDDRLAADRGDASLFDSFRRSLGKSARGQLAPFKCVDAVQAAAELPFDEGLARERELFEECMASPQREALVHAFFAERQVWRIPEMEGAEPRNVAALGVVGGGTMGSGIAVAGLLAGFPVVMVERDEESLERGRGQVAKFLEGSVKRGKLTAEQRDEVLEARFSAATEYDALADADLVVEAVFEDLDVKKEVFASLDASLRAGAVLATNTSYLDVNEIAVATARPEDVLGLHFFSPAHVMRLLEVVVADATAPEVTATGFALAKKLGKTAVRAGVCDGFIGNRILASYRRQADYMMEDGASPWQIDAAVREFGFPMGPYEVADLAGLDIGWANRKRLAPTRDPRERYVEIADRICERGWFGQKTGRGFYRYAEGSRKGEPDPEVERIIDEERERKGITPREFSDEDIMRRYLAAMINEAAKAVEEGVALRPLDVDVVLLHGYGFPRWRGGPMKYADMAGLDSVLADIRRCAEEDELAWRPSKLLADLVERGESLDSLNRKRD